MLQFGKLKDYTKGGRWKKPVILKAVSDFAVKSNKFVHSLNKWTWYHLTGFSTGPNQVPKRKKKRSQNVLKNLTNSFKKMEPSSEHG